MTNFKLSRLPWRKDSLVPGISVETITIQHEKIQMVPHKL